jgi:hypothetical protein
VASGPREAMLAPRATVAGGKKKSKSAKAEKKERNSAGNTSTAVAGASCTLIPIYLVLDTALIEGLWGITAAASVEASGEETAGGSSDTGHRTSTIGSGGRWVHVPQ